MLLQEKHIAACRQLGAETPTIEAILMYGSFTQGCGDQYSDIEFYVFIDDDAFDSFDRHHWVQRIAPYHLHCVNEYGTDVYIFEDFIRGEFHFLPTNQMEVIPTFAMVGYIPDPDAMNLYDRHDLLHKQLQTLHDVTPPWQTAETIQSLIGNLLNMALYGKNVLKRGEIARSLECLFFCQRYCLQLMRLQEQTIDHWLNPAKALEEELSQENYQRYQQCTAPLEEAAIQSAYHALLTICQQLAQILGQTFAIDPQTLLFDKLLMD